MRIEFRLQPYLYKYYCKRWDVETSIMRKSIPGMLALAQIKDYMTTKTFSTEQLTEPVYFTVPSKKGLRLTIKNPDTNSLIGFNWNIRTIFYDEMYLRISTEMQARPNAILLDEIRAWMAKYDLSEDDISEQTLRREYHRMQTRSVKSGIDTNSKESPCEARQVA